MLGNVKFIGELFAEKMLNETIILQCIKRLLDSLDKDTIEVCMYTHTHTHTHTSVCAS